jgi:predicted dehydrogenase
MSDAPVRAAVIGLGMMGANHARVLDELPEAELVGVADLDPAALARATDGRDTRGYADAADLLARERPELVVVAVPTSLHLRATLDALAAGAHVLVEKPIAAERAEAEEMIAAARAAGRLLTVGHIERFNPAIRELSRRLADEELGRVFQVRATRLGPFPARVRDVGVVVDLAPHDLDVMRYLLRAEPIRIYAETEQRIHTDHEDLFTGLVKFGSGAIGLLEINWLTPTKVRRLTVTGERGMYEADYLTQDLVFYANPDQEAVAVGERTEREVERREPLAVELSEFVTAIRTGGPPPVAPHDALVAMLLARAMVDSATRGTVIGADELAPLLA